MSWCYTSRAEKEKSWKVIFDISKLFRDSAFLSSQQIEDYRKDGIVVVDRYNFGIVIAAVAVVAMMGLLLLTDVCSMGWIKTSSWIDWTVFKC